MQSVIQLIRENPFGSFIIIILALGAIEHIAVTVAQNFGH